MKFFLKVLFLILIYFSSATADINFQQKKFYYENLVKNWSKIFPDSNRNAAGPRFFKYLIDQDLTYEEFKEYNKFYCPVSGSLINPGEKPDYIYVKELRTQKNICGELYRCCWPCSCDVMKHARAELVEIQLPNDPSLEVDDYWVLTIGDPCHKCDDMPCEDLPEEVTAYQCKDGHTQNGLRVFEGKLTTEREGRLVFVMLHNVDTQNLTSSSVPSELLNACQPRINANPTELQNMSGMGNIFVDLSLVNSSEHYSNNNDDLCQ